MAGGYKGAEQFTVAGKQSRGPDPGQKATHPPPTRYTENVPHHPWAVPKPIRLMVTGQVLGPGRDRGIACQPPRRPETGAEMSCAQD